MKDLLALFVVLTLMLAVPAFCQETGDVEVVPTVIHESTEIEPAEEPAVEEVEPAPADEEEPRPRGRTAYGLMIGSYNPVNSTVKGVFGDNWPRYGLRPLPLDLPEKWRPTWDVSFYSMSRLNNSATIMPITGGFLRGFGKGKDRAYASVTVGPCYYNVNSPTLGVDNKGWRLGGSATLGFTFRDRLSIEGRYELMDDFAGLDFSAFTVSATLRLFTMR